MKYRDAVHLYGFLMVTGGILVLVGILLFESMVVSYVGIAMMLVAIFAVDPFLKCPKCGCHLDTKYCLPDKCPRCGMDLKKAM